MPDRVCARGSTMRARRRTTWTRRRCRTKRPGPTSGVLISCIERPIMATPAELESWVRQGAAALQAGRSKDGRALLERVVTTGRTNVQVWMLLALACRQMGGAAAGGRAGGGARRGGAGGRGARGG